MITKTSVAYGESGDKVIFRDFGPDTTGISNLRAEITIMTKRSNNVFTTTTVQFTEDELAGLRIAAKLFATSLEQG